MKQSYLTMMVIAAGLVVASLVQASTIDVTTQGNWIGTYGNAGYILPQKDASGGEWTGPADKTNDHVSLPSYVADYSYTNIFGYKPPETVDVPSTDPLYAAILQDPRGPGYAWRTHAFAYSDAASSPSGGKVSLTLAANAPDFQLAVNMLSLVHLRSETMAAKWQGESTAFDSALVQSVDASQWAVFNVSPGGKTSLDIIITPGVGSFNGEFMISGIALNSVPEPGSLVLFGFALTGLLAYAWRRRR
jgi:hypothetical protein